MKMILEFNPTEAKNAIKSGTLLAVMEKAVSEENAVRAAVNTVDQIPPATQQPAPVQQQPIYPTSMPNTVPQPQPPTGPIQQQMQPQAPVQQQTAPQQPVVPTSQAAPAYTMDQLAVAATQLVDAGKMNELRGILQSFNVAALTELPKDRYGEFATALRQNGVKI